MKFKQLFAVALVLFSAGAWAQTDVTSTYLTNADFEGTYTSVYTINTDRYVFQPDGWTVDYVNKSTWNMTVVKSTDAMASNFTGIYAVPSDNQKYMVRFRDNQPTEYVDLSQTITINETGAYTFAADLIREDGSKINVELYAGSNSVSNSSAGTWENRSFTVNLTAGTEIKVGIKFTNKAANGVKAGADNITITFTDPLKAGKDALQAEIDKAKLCDAKEGLADAIATAEGVLASATTAAELEDALAALQAADKDAVLRYENGLADATALAPVVTSFVVNGTFDNSDISMWSCNTSFQNRGRKTTDDGGAGNMNSTKPWWENWNGSALVNKMSQTITNIPNGTYRLDITAFVNKFDAESQYVFANSDQTPLTEAAKSGAVYEVYTVVTNNQIEVGLEQTTATANWMGIDNVSLRYYGAGDVINDAQNAAHKQAWLEAKAAAESAIANSDYANVTGSEKSDLQTEIGKAEPTTADGYDEARAALEEATATFTVAKAAYDAFITAKTAEYPVLTYAATSKRTDLDDACNAEAATSASDAETKAGAIFTALRAYYESHALAEGVEGVVNMTDRITNANDPTNNDGWTWSGSKNNPASNESWTDADGTNNHTYFDGGNWNSNSWTTTMKQIISLPAGKFLLTAKARAAINTTFTMAVGDESVDLHHIGNAGNVFGRGWGDASLEFETDGSDVEILVTATTNTQYEWFSIADFRLVRLELYTEMATEADYEAMATALAAAKAKTLGFDEGEFAPYNNVEAIQAIATAENVDTDAENAKADIEAITAALGNWTANTAEVNAIYDGDFNIQPAHTTGPTTLAGWTAVEGLRQLIKNAETDPGLTYASANAAIFTWGGTTITYGEQDGYTLPLDANVYELTFKVAGWRDGDWPNWMSAALYKNGSEVETVVKTPTIVGKINDAEGNPFITLTYYLTVPEAGNYVLKLYTNKHTTWTDFNFVKAVAEPITIDETIDYTPAETFANITLKRNFKVNDWNTFIVPFDIPNEILTETFGDDVQVAEFSDEGESANAVTVNFIKMDTPAITANTPVLLKPTSEELSNQIYFNAFMIEEGTPVVGGSYFDFTGTYAASTTIAEGDYFISANKLYKSKGSTTLKGTRAYLKARESIGGEVKLFIEGEGIVTAIEGIDGNVNLNGNIFTIAGQRVNKAQKGIYIVNGKKIIVK